MEDISSSSSSGPDDQTDGTTFDPSEGVVRIYQVTDDGRKMFKGEMMNIKSCPGYYTFASRLRDRCDRYGLDDIICHVLWPLHSFDTRYMDRNQHELDPRRLPWCSFSKYLKEIWVKEARLGTNGYSLVMRDEDIDVNKLRIIFRHSDGDFIRDIDRRFIDNNFRSFQWIIHTFWAVRSFREPIPPFMVTDKNISLESDFSVEFFDERGRSIDIPTYLSRNPDAAEDADDDADDNDADADADDEQEEFDQMISSDDDGEGDVVDDGNSNIPINEQLLIGFDDDKDLEINNKEDVQNFLRSVTKVLFVKHP